MLAVNGAFRRHVDHGGNGEVGANGRAAVENSGSGSQATIN